MDQPVIFFDFNGVLDNKSIQGTDPFLIFRLSQEACPEKVGRLLRLAKITKAKLVPISMYRLYIYSDGFFSIFRRVSDPSIPMSLIEEPTPNFDNEPVPDSISQRAMEITAWREMQQHTGPYIVIDDEWIGGVHPHVHTDAKSGFDEQQFKHAKFLLEAQGVEFYPDAEWEK